MFGMVIHRPTHPMLTGCYVVRRTCNAPRITIRDQWPSGRRLPAFQAGR
jgi:hypothetical protein